MWIIRFKNQCGLRQDQCRNVETIQILFGERQVKMMQL